MEDILYFVLFVIQLELTETAKQLSGGGESSGQVMVAQSLKKGWRVGRQPQMNHRAKL